MKQEGNAWWQTDLFNIVAEAEDKLASLCTLNLSSLALIIINTEKRNT